MKIIILFLAAYFPILAQISPGDLSSAHAHLEGISSCTRCHELGEKVSSEKCLRCHQEISSLIKAGRGYHSGSEVKSKECSTCHNEHHGRKFRLIKFEPKEFNHSLTGFNLTGAHEKVLCKECHQPKNITDKKLSSKSGTYLGLNVRCLSCHSDIHKGSLPQDCSACHTTDSFKPAARFNHNNAKFKLTGRHAAVVCLKCHPKAAGDGVGPQKFTGIKYQQCSDCHKDIHNGKLGSECQKCHSTSSFRSVSQKDFNHGNTGFILKGRHINVECRNCHKTSVKEKLRFERCSNCHSDFHKGEFSSGVKFRDCSECHNAEGFSPSLFSIDEHQKSAFRLEGAHLAIPCRSCHYKNSSWSFRNIGTNCSDCHRNPHGNEIAGQYNSEGCINCHNVNNWTTISFNHSVTNFQLTGKHLNVSCSSCHLRSNEYKFLSLTSECVLCHSDVHYGQFVIESKNDCQRCHAFDSWKPEKFNHNNTSFPLTGAHSKINCSECHRKESRDNISFIKYKTDNKCTACHS